MSLTESTYYGLTRIREASPEAQDWAVTDANPELISRLLKTFESHTHTGTASINYPGYNAADPTNPTLPTTTEVTTGGFLTPGTDLGFRLAYVNSLGLETEGSTEKLHTVSVSTQRALTPEFVSTQAPVSGPGLSGGTYIYVVTKKRLSGETEMSDILAVNVPYDSTYGVTIRFDAINTYTDGTDGINIYRSQGLDSSFQLLTTITTTTTNTYTDNNVIASQNVNVQPPSTSTFDATKKVTLSWSNITHPTGATALRVYVTQQFALWSTQHLLSEISLSGTPATSITYLGSESLGAGWPKNISQVPSSPGKLNLSTEATGAPTLTANQNFNKFQAQNIVVHNFSGTPATPVNGQLVYDTSASQMKAYINGAWVPWGTATANATGYAHPAEDAGGHLASNIRYVTGSGTNNVSTILGRIVDTSGNAKQVSGISKIVGAGGTTTANTSSSAPDQLLNMQLLALSPSFNNQYVNVMFNAHVTNTVAEATISVILEWAGILQDDTASGGSTVRSVTIPAAGGSATISLIHTLQAPSGARDYKIKWWTSTGVATAQAGRRSLTVQFLY